MEVFFSFLERFMFPEYTLAVILLTQALKAVIRWNKKEIHPKYLTLAIGSALALSGFLVGYFPTDGLNLMRLIISFSLAGMGYTYVVRIVLDMFKKRITDGEQ